MWNELISIKLIDFFAILMVFPDGMVPRKKLIFFSYIENTIRKIF